MSSWHLGLSARSAKADEVWRRAMNKNANNSSKGATVRYYCINLFLLK